MKNQYLKPTLFVTLITFCTASFLSAKPEEIAKPDAQKASITHPELKVFPAAKAGMERFVIVLPHKERGEEDAFRIELIPGKMMETDGVNLYSFGDILKEKNLEGFGYPMYEVSEGVVKMTLMRPGKTPVIKFVIGVPHHIRYNSRLPIVIYAPAGYEVRYRIWKASEAITPAPKG